MPNQSTFRMMVGAARGMGPGDIRLLGQAVRAQAGQEDRIQYGLVARRLESALVAHGPHDVIELALVRRQPDRDLVILLGFAVVRLLLLGQVLRDPFLGLVQRHAGHEDVTGEAQVDEPVGLDNERRGRRRAAGAYRDLQLVRRLDDIGRERRPCAARAADADRSTPYCGIRFASCFLAIVEQPDGQEDDHEGREGPRSPAQSRKHPCLHGYAASPFRCEGFPTSCRARWQSVEDGSGGIVGLPVYWTGVELST